MTQEEMTRHNEALAITKNGKVDSRPIADLELRLQLVSARIGSLEDEIKALVAEKMATVEGYKKEQELLLQLTAMYKGKPDEIDMARKNVIVDRKYDLPAATDTKRDCAPRSGSLTQRILDILESGPCEAHALIDTFGAEPDQVWKALSYLRNRNKVERTMPGGHTYRLKK